MVTLTSRLLQLSPRQMHSAQAAMLRTQFRWIRGYTRDGQTVRGHWRRRPTVAAEDVPEHMPEIFVVDTRDEVREAA